LKLDKVGSPQACNRVPSSSSSEAVGATTRIRARRDIIETGETSRIQPWVQEAERGFSLTDSIIVQQRDDGTESWASSGSSSDACCESINDDGEVICLRCYVREAATSSVIVGRVRGALGSKERRDGARLIGGLRKVVTEATLAERDAYLRGNLVGTTDSGHIRANRRECWNEFDGIRAVVCLAASSANATITRGIQKRATTGTDLGESVADPGGVIERDCVFIISIRSRESGGNSGLVANIIKPVNIRFVGVGCSVSVRCVWRPSTSAVVDKLGGIVDTRRILNVKVGFSARIVLVVQTVVNLHMRHRETDGIGPVFLVEGLQIRIFGIVFQVPSHTNRVVSIRNGSVVDGVIQSSKAARCDGGIA